MKIVYLHGDDTEKIYARFSKIIDGVRKKSWRIEEISSGDDVKNKLVNTSLFGEDILYTIKNAEKIDKNNLNWITDNHKNFSSQLLLLANKKLTAAQKKSLPKETNFEEFVKPVLLWQFLDSIYPGNSKKSLDIFSKLSKTEATELIVSLLAGLFKDMYLVHKNISLKYADWRAKKIKSQAQKFTLTEIKNFIKNLSEIDIASKTSDIDANLLIEMLIVKNLG